jgi:hypothetical protein
MNSEDLSNQAVASDVSAHANNSVAPPAGYVPQEKVNDLLKAKTSDAYERGKMEAMQALQAQQTPQQTQAQNFLTEDKLYEKLQNIQDQYVVNQMLSQHEKAKELGRSEYPDFDAVTSTIDVKATPSWIPLLQSVPNVQDVYYELGKDDRRFMDIQMALISGQTAKAQKMIKTISESIQDNKQAQQKASPSAPAPLSKVKPSTASADSGTMSYADMKAAVMKNKKR